jgi:hypothetical protein
MISYKPVFFTFRDEAPDVKKKTSEARRMLELWRESYFEVRAKIEQSGRDARWEFDRRRLFERTNYMVSICTDLHDVAQVSTNNAFIFHLTSCMFSITRWVSILCRNPRLKHFTES